MRFILWVSHSVAFTTVKASCHPRNHIGRLRGPGRSLGNGAEQIFVVGCAHGRHAERTETVKEK